MLGEAMIITVVVPPTVPVRTTRRLGRYETIARIAGGGMAEVYLARQTGPLNFAKLVVIKTIHPHLASQRDLVDMLLDEARIAAQIKHPHIVDIYDLGHDGDTYFIAMEYLAGESLADVIVASKKAPRLGIYSMVALVAECAEALHAAHTWCGMDGRPLSVVHRDVTPGNIIVLYNGDVKLVDFGVAKARGRAVVTGTDTRLKGKIGYVAPEQLDGHEADPRCDVFSLGIVLWEALTLRRLFWAPTEAAVVRAILSGRVTPPSQVMTTVPRELDAICQRALARRPDERYPTARAFCDDLRGFLREANYHDHERVVASFMSRTFATRMLEREGLIREAIDAAAGAVPDMPGLRTGIAEEIDDDEPSLQIEVAGAHGSSRMPLAAPDETNPGPSGPLMTAASSPVPQAVDDNDLTIQTDFDDEHSYSDLTEAGPVPPADAPPQVGMFVADLSPAPRPRHRRGLVAAVAGVLTLGGLVVFVAARGADRGEPAPAAVAVDSAPIAAGTAPEPPPPPPAPEPTVQSIEPPPVEPAPAAADRAPRRKPRDRDEPRVSTERPLVPDRPAPERTPPPPSSGPSSPQRLYNEGMRLQVGGDTTGAIAKFKAALDADKHYAPAYRGLGLAYERQGRNDRAARAFREYLSLAGNAPDAAAIRARLTRIE